MEPGTIAFRTDGDSLVLPYGPTPISHDGECRPTSPCNVLGAAGRWCPGAADGPPGDPIRVERA
ncbi:cyclophilin-like family protein [Kitasatospora sp. NPDC093102]|uniref:cyclophilin-like family protein n=1 Tax=Kitasatospora sp. NPDC093102 TaxID=3155069 RepID=UPI0034337637